MAAYDVESLLREISSDQPAGDDLEYDPDFRELTTLAQRKPEQQFGDTIIPGEEPDWRSVEKAAIALFDRTKDLRVALQLTVAAIHTGGYEGFDSGLGVIRGLVERYWDNLYPLLDPEDDNDPTARVNAIVTLADRIECLVPLREAPIVESRLVGRLSLRQIETAVADGADDAPPGAVKMSTIDAAFTDSPVESLSQRLETIRSAIAHAKAIEVTVTDYVGVGNAPSLIDLVRQLNDASRILTDRVARRSGGEQEAAADGVDEGEGGGGSVPGGSGGKGVSVPGRIASRADVKKAIERICDYYVQAEPASPVPILLDRARRLVDKNFMQLLEDLAPSGATEFQVFRGNVEE